MKLTANIQGMGWTPPIEFNEPARRDGESTDAFDRRVVEEQTRLVLKSLVFNAFVTAEE